MEAIAPDRRERDAAGVSMPVGSARGTRGGLGPARTVSQAASSPAELRLSGIRRSSFDVHVRNSSNVGLHGNPGYSGFKCPGPGNNAAVVAWRNKTGMVWYRQRVMCFLSDSGGSVC